MCLCLTRALEHMTQKLRNLQGGTEYIGQRTNLSEIKKYSEPSNNGNTIPKFVWCSEISAWQENDSTEHNMEKKKDLKLII